MKIIIKIDVKRIKWREMCTYVLLRQ